MGCDRRADVPKGVPETPVQEAANPAPASGSSDPAQAPQTLIYNTDPNVYTKGVAIQPNNPSTGGGPAAAFTVRPALPAGLSLDPVSGVISGTPSAAAAKATYEVVASNKGGSASTIVTLTVNEPVLQPVVTLPAFVTTTLGNLVASTQDQGKEAKYQWEISGGSLDSGQGTPSITFKAGAEGTLTAQVTVTTPSGRLSGRAESTILPVPLANFSLPVAVKAGTAGLTVSIPPQAGMTYTWTIIPGTGSATLTSGQGTNSIAFTAGSVPGSFQVQATAQNQAGDRVNGTGTVNIVP
jgi:hypothetical protein